MDKTELNKTDWSKIFMGAAVALVFIMQQWHSMQMSDIKADLVPRPEFQRKADTIMGKDEILDAFKDFSRRLEQLEMEKTDAGT